MRIHFLTEPILKHNCWWRLAPYIVSFDTIAYAANPYGATTIRTSPTRVTHSPLPSNPFSGLMLPELLALTGNFESSALHSEPSYSLYGASWWCCPIVSWLKVTSFTVNIRRHIVVSTGNAPVFLVYQTSVLLLYDKTIWCPCSDLNWEIFWLRVNCFSQFSYKGVYKQYGADRG